MELEKLIEKARSKAEKQMRAIEYTAERNQRKVLEAFWKHHLSETHFNPTYGYGFNDRGRDIIDLIYADVFEAEDALVRTNFVSGTHTLTVALFGVLRPGDTLLAVTGKPYDTLDNVIGISPCDGSLAEFGVGYRQIELKDGRADIPAIEDAVRKNERAVVFIQRSKGYANRPTLSVSEIGEIAEAVKRIRKETVVIVDNCYGEFTELTEPTAAGADLIVGSLIKNPGGGMADTGGYIAGKASLIEKCANRLTVPSQGKEVGATLGHNRNIIKGLFYAPHTVAQSLKTAVFAAALFEEMGYDVNPGSQDSRSDIIQIISLKTRENLISFCRGIQAGSPVDSFVTPEPYDMPGYNHEVIMAAGTFVQGASIELSADAPVCEPYDVYLQGGLTYESGMVGVIKAAEAVLSNSKE